MGSNLPELLEQLMMKSKDTGLRTASADRATGLRCWRSFEVECSEAAWKLGGRGEYGDEGRWVWL